MFSYWCYCFDLAKGNLLYAWIQIFWSIYVFYRGIVINNENKEQMKNVGPEEWKLLDQYSFFIWLCFLVHFANIVVSLIFIQGIKQRSSSKLKPYLCVKVINLFIYLMMIMYFWVQWLSALIFVVMIIELYFFICSCSLYNVYYNPCDESSAPQSAFYDIA